MFSFRFSSKKCFGEARAAKAVDFHGGSAALQYWSAKAALQETHKFYNCW
jgi:hypothetical protein